MSDLDDLAREVAKRNGPATQSFEAFASTAGPRQRMPCAATRNAKTRYRDRVGIRSFVCQIALAIWSFVMGIFAVAILVRASTAPPTFPGSHVEIDPVAFGGMYRYNYQFAKEDQMKVAERECEWLLAPWLIIALPIGLTAIGTLRADKRWA